ncbi:hypothetical protein [Klebsiella pneumoniae]|uniref:hypothetical protein n=1 Tax=Klebsiella pneumoniae TaxID=573 RepID=UPI00115B36A7|nr:hypothetical protein [Klebsiella pneumoniae]
METTYISFSFNDKHYLVRESEITDRWPSITNRNVENLILKNGFQYRATNIKEVTFLDFSSLPERSVIVTDEPFDF